MLTPTLVTGCPMGSGIVARDGPNVEMVDDLTLMAKQFKWSPIPRARGIADQMTKQYLAGEEQLTLRPGDWNLKLETR
jgi:hypothetical protein